METSTQPITHQRRPRPQGPRRWRPAIAGGLAVFVMAAIFLISQSRDAVLDLVRTSPVEIASRYMEARNAYDAAAARAVLADDATIVDTPMMDLAELDMGFEALRGFEWRFERFDCQDTGSDPERSIASVTCTYMMDAKLLQIVGDPPVSGSFGFFIEDGRIIRLLHNFNFQEYSPNYGKYVDWLIENHPGVYEQIYRTVGGTDTPILTREARDLEARYLEEFDRFVNG